MALDDNNRGDKLERDPQLARLLQAAGGEEPPAAIDAAIRAAARREVSARPQVVAGGGETSATPAPVVRARRNWYVPVSIAAVLLLSVSLVTQVHQEKGDEVAQLPQLPRRENTPATAQAPAAVSEPQAEAPAAAYSDKPDTMLNDAVPAKPKLAEKTPGDAPVAAKAAPAAEATADLAKKQRTKDADAVAGGAPAVLGSARRDQPSASVKREQEAAANVAAAPPPAASPPVPPPPVTPAPAESKVLAEPFPAQPSRDALETRQRSEADRGATRGAMPEAPAAPVPMPAPAAVAPRSTPVMPAQSEPSAADGRVRAVPPPPMVAAKPAAQAPALRMADKRAPPWRGLEDQPPAKWLEKLAEFKRDGRPAEADELMAEFRRRFPEHPASVR